MKILLIDSTPETACASAVLHQLKTALEARAIPYSTWHLSAAAVSETFIALVDTGRPLLRYSGSDAADPVIAAVAAHRLKRLADEDMVASSSTVAVALLPPDAGAQIPAFTPAGLLMAKGRFAAHLALADRDLASSAEMPWLLDALREFVLGALGPWAFLRGSRWHPDLRLREEVDGGLLFVPETSQLVELEQAAFDRVREAVRQRRPLQLAAPRLPRLDRVIAALASAGALVPHAAH